MAEWAEQVAGMRNNRTAVNILVGNTEGNRLFEEPGPNMRR